MSFLGAHARPLTLARISFFTIIERTWGEGHPRAISFLIVIELRNNDQQVAWDIPNSNGVRLYLFRSNFDTGETSRRFFFLGGGEATWRRDSCQ